jgi:hypothetical protein
MRKEDADAGQGNGSIKELKHGNVLKIAESEASGHPIRAKAATLLIG